MGQQDAIPVTSDPKYREDQFYVGLTYNLLLQRPQDMIQVGLSYGFHAGFIRDFPINAQRNVAIGVGLGYSGNNYYSNLRALKDGDGNVSYDFVDSETSRDTSSRSRFGTHLAEIPIEFRWRTSTDTKYKFWRVYAGVRVGYVFSNVSVYREDGFKTKFSNPDMNGLLYGLTLSVGYNTWNFYAYYGLTPLLKDGTTTVDGEEIRYRDLKLGLMFYIL